MSALLFEETERWKVSITEFDPAYWAIRLRVTHKPTRRWTGASFTLETKAIVFNREVKGVPALTLSPENRTRMLDIFRQFEELHKKAKVSWERIKAEALEVTSSES